MPFNSAARHIPPPTVEPAMTARERPWFRIPSDAFTLRGFREWAASSGFPEFVRAGFLDGEIFLDMSNEDPQTHVLVKGEIARVLANLCKELKLGVLYTDGVLISNETAGVSNNPDGSFVRWETFESGTARLVPRGEERHGHSEIEGTPDWVLEVLSDSSVDKDTRQLRRAYHRAGIPEYWIIDARGDQVVFQVLTRRRNGYAVVPPKEGWRKSRVFEREFRLTRQRTRMNLWEYTLEMR